MKRGALVACAVVCLCSGPAGSWLEARPGEGESDEGPAAGHLLDRLPKDPLLVSVMNEGTLADVLDGWLELAARLGGDEVAATGLETALAGFDDKLGCSLHDDLLARIGPGFAFVLDLPPIDSLVVGASDPTMIPGMLANAGFVARARGGEALDSCLRRLLTLEAGEAVEEEGMVRVTLPLSAEESGAEGPSLSAYYAIADGVLALGVAPEFVRASLASRPEGRRLIDGADYRLVSSHLDAEADTLAYLNLPKLRDMASSSQIVRSLVQEEAEVQPLFEFLMDPEFIAAGAGSTSRGVEGGTRTTTFGPSLFSGGTATAGILAAVAIPNFLEALDRGKQKRTVADVRAAGTVCEAFAVDRNRYPGPTDGWVDLASIAPEVEPVYIRTLPVVDGWGHALRFWSDGESYRIVSPGKDGTVEVDWSVETEGGPTTSFDADIVFADGRFVRWPEGSQE